MNTHEAQSTASDGGKERGIRTLRHQFRRAARLERRRRDTLPPYVDALSSGGREEDRIPRPGDRHRDDDRALLSRPAKHAGIDCGSAIHRNDPAIEIG
jgi:hypothetical protein